MTLAGDLGHSLLYQTLLVHTDQEWSCRIGHRLFYSIISRRSQHSRITLGVHTTSNQRLMGVTRMGRSLHIALPTSDMNCLHRPWFVPISQSSSGMDYVHNLQPSNNVQAISGVALPHRPCKKLPIYVRRGAGRLGRRVDCPHVPFHVYIASYRWAWNRCIALVLQTSIIHIMCFLNTSPLSCIKVNRRRTQPSCIAFTVHKMDR